MDKEHNKNFIENHLGKLFNSKDINYCIVQDESEIRINEINLGIVSGFPIWSGYSILFGNKMITDLIPFLSAEKEWFKWIILDSDFIDDEFYTKTLQSNKWGYFESIFIQNGDVLKYYHNEKEYQPFVEFSIKQLDLRKGILNDNLSKTYLLDLNKDKLGISVIDFTTEKRAIINSNSKYKGEYLFDLMKYKKEGHFYIYEDNNVVIYDPTRPTPLSSCFIDFKPLNQNRAST